jgi:hypothetical protein
MPAFHLNGENPWKLGLGFLALTFFLGIGIAHVLRPDYFLKRSAIRKGGEMLTEFNRVGVQIVGLLVALFALGIIYDIAKGLF